MIYRGNTMKHKNKKKGLILLWFILINYAFMGWAASCGGKPFKPLTDRQAVFVLLGSVPAAAAVIFFIMPLESKKEKISYMIFSAKLTFIVSFVWLNVALSAGII